MKRGASFAHSLSGLLGGASPHGPLLRLAEKGVVCADSFVPVRQWLEQDRMESRPVGQRVKSRVMALTGGRWELARPVRQPSMEEQLERAFARACVLCRETAGGLPWADAMRVLRVWEYTGRARRGYFVAGMSGMQYILENQYAGITQALEQPDDRILWLPAADPAQPWGKCLAHSPDRAFMGVPGTAVALQAGLPVAVFEQQGKTLRVFDPASLPDALQVSVRDFSGRRVFPALRRLSLKHYPKEAADTLRSAGFAAEMQDFMLYRKM
jgi:ATP-dependent Lhr-like helicase